MRNFSTVFSAWDGDKLVGMVCAMDDGVMNAYLHYMLVCPEYHRQGIGHTLLGMMKERYKSYLRIILIAYDLELKFYESCGFKKGENEKVLSEVLGITLTRTSAKDITAQQAAFPAASLDRTHQRCPSSSFICSHEHHSHNYADFSRLYPVYAPFGSVSLRPLCYYPQPLNQQR